MASEHSIKCSPTMKRRPRLKPPKRARKSFESKPIVLPRLKAKTPNKYCKSSGRKKRIKNSILARLTKKRKTPTIFAKKLRQKRKRRLWNES